MARSNSPPPWKANVRPPSRRGTRKHVKRGLEKKRRREGRPFSAASRENTGAPVVDQRNLRNRSPFRSCTNLIRPMHGMRNDRVLRLCVYIYIYLHLVEKWSSLPSFWWTIHHRNTRKRKRRRRSADFTAGYLFFRAEC